MKTKEELLNELQQIQNEIKVLSIYLCGELDRIIEENDNRLFKIFYYDMLELKINERFINWQLNSINNK